MCKILIIPVLDLRWNFVLLILYSLPSSTSDLMNLLQVTKILDTPDVEIKSQYFEALCEHRERIKRCQQVWKFTSTARRFLIFFLTSLPLLWTAGNKTDLQPAVPENKNSSVLRISLAVTTSLSFSYGSEEEAAQRERWHERWTAMSRRSSR